MAVSVRHAEELLRALRLKMAVRIACTLFLVLFDPLLIDANLVAAGSATTEDHRLRGLVAATLVATSLLYYLCCVVPWLWSATRTYIRTWRQIREIGRDEIQEIHDAE